MLSVIVVVICVGLVYNFMCSNMVKSQQQFAMAYIFIIFSCKLHCKACKESSASMAYFRADNAQLFIIFLLFSNVKTSIGILVLSNASLLCSLLYSDASFPTLVFFCSEKWLPLGRSWRKDKLKNGKGMYDIWGSIIRTGHY